MLEIVRVRKHVRDNESVACNHVAKPELFAVIIVNSRHRRHLFGIFDIHVRACFCKRLNPNLPRGQNTSSKTPKATSVRGPFHIRGK